MLSVKNYSEIVKFYYFNLRLQLPVLQTIATQCAHRLPVSIMCLPFYVTQMLVKFGVEIYKRYKSEMLTFCWGSSSSFLPLAKVIRTVLHRGGLVYPLPYSFLSLTTTNHHGNSDESRTSIEPAQFWSVLCFHYICNNYWWKLKIVHADY